MTNLIALIMKMQKKDVIPFIKDPSVLNIWSANFFKAITENLKTNECDF